MKPHDDSDSVPRRRSARSLDSDSRTKAAAWVGQAHGKSGVTDGRFVAQPRSSERKESRFRAEAMQEGSQRAAEPPSALGVWDGRSPRRRSARSLDHDSSSEATASPMLLNSDFTDGRFVSQHGSCERKESRFRVEAMQGGESQKPAEPVSTEGVWDCGSILYDTLELVSFSDRLDRSLMGLPSAGAANFHHAESPLHQATGLLRTLSLPRNMSMNGDSSETLNTATSPVLAPRLNERTGHRKRHSRTWCIAKLVKVFRTAATLRDRMRRRSKGNKTHQLEEEGKQHHYRHFHHHHHHHHLYRLDDTNEAGSSIVKRHEVNCRLSPVRRTESARLSTDTVAPICFDKNWW